MLSQANTAPLAFRSHCADMLRIVSASGRHPLAPRILGHQFRLADSSETRGAVRFARLDSEGRVHAGNRENSLNRSGEQAFILLAPSGDALSRLRNGSASTSRPAPTSSFIVRDGWRKRVCAQQRAANRVSGGAASNKSVAADTRSLPQAGKPTGRRG